MVDTVERVHLEAQQVRPALARRASARVLYLDILRVVAALAVVAIHTTATELYTLQDRTEPGWRVALILNTASRWCVPAYVLASGALVLTYRQRMTTEHFLRSRVLRVAVPLLGWSVIYTAWQVYYLHSLRLGTWRDVWTALATPSYWHLWFLYMLLGLYLATPVLSVVVQHASRRLLWATTAVCFVPAAWTLVATPLHLPAAFFWYFPLGIDMGYVGYFLLGFLLVTAGPLPGRWRGLVLLAAVVLGGCGVALTALATYQASVTTYTDTLATYTTPLTLATATAVFVLCRAVPWERILNGRRTRAALTGLSLSTFGIYLVHPLLLWTLLPWYETPAVQAVTHAPVASVPTQLLLPLALFALSLVLVVPLRHLPIVRWLIP